MPSELELKVEGKKTRILFVEGVSMLHAAKPALMSIWNAFAIHRSSDIGAGKAQESFAEFSGAALQRLLGLQTDSFAIAAGIAWML